MAGQSDIVWDDDVKWDDVPRVGMGDVKMADAPMQNATNVPAAMLTGDPETDWRIAALAAARGEKKAITKTDALKAAAIAAGMATGTVGLGPIVGGALGGGLIAAGTSPSETPDRAMALDALKGAGSGAAGGAVLKGLSALVARALPRAYRLAFKTLNPSASEAAEAEAKLGSWENAGKVIDEAGASKIGLTMRKRRDVLRALGDKAGPEIERILAEAHAKGASVDKGTLIAQIQGVSDKYFGRPGTVGMTPTLRRGQAAAQRFMDDLAANPDIGAGQPISNVENLKQIAQTEGYLRGGRYADPTVAKKDPAVGFFRGASGALRQAPEQAIEKVDPLLAEAFKVAKEQSGTSQAFAPVASRAANVQFSGDSILPSHGWSGKSIGFHAFYDPAIASARSYLIPVNKGMQWMYDAAPDGTATTLADALVAALRKRKKEGE